VSFIKKKRKVRKRVAFLKKSVSKREGKKQPKGRYVYRETGREGDRESYGRETAEKKKKGNHRGTGNGVIMRRSVVGTINLGSRLVAYRSQDDREIRRPVHENLLGEQRRMGVVLAA